MDEATSEANCELLSFLREHPEAEVDAGKVKTGTLKQWLADLDDQSRAGVRQAWLIGRVLDAQRGRLKRGQVKAWEARKAKALGKKPRSLQLYRQIAKGLDDPKIATALRLHHLDFGLQATVRHIANVRRTGDPDLSARKKATPEVIEARLRRQLKRWLADADQVEDPAALLRWAGVEMGDKFKEMQGDGDPAQASTRRVSRWLTHIEDDPRRLLLVAAAYAEIGVHLERWLDEADDSGASPLHTVLTDAVAVGARAAALRQSIELVHADSLEHMRGMDADSVAACVSDPPYGINFAEWDDPGEGSATAFEGWATEWLTEVHRVLGPGGVCKVFSSTKTYHRVAAAMEAVGFTLVPGDALEAWTYANGFPKGANIAKAIDRRLGVKGDLIRTVKRRNAPTGLVRGARGDGQVVTREVREPASDLAKQFHDYRTTLKPAWEPVLVGVKAPVNAQQVEGLGSLVITVARKPLSEPSITGNVMRHGTGALNIGGTRTPGGKWPANLLLTEIAALDLTAQAVDRVPPRSVFKVIKLCPGQAGEAHGVSG